MKTKCQRIRIKIMIMTKKSKRTRKNQHKLKKIYKKWKKRDSNGIGKVKIRKKNKK